MHKIREFCRRECVLTVTALLTVISLFFIPPDRQYLAYIDFRVIGLLFCLMAVVAALQQENVFRIMACRLLSYTDNCRKLFFILTLICFFSSMLITNDVALLTFVPLTITLFDSIKEEKLIFIIVMETAAANLGSLLTPIGNPQNLYLFSRYHFTLGQFFTVTMPLGAFCLALILLFLWRFAAPGQISQKPRKNPERSKGRLCLYASLFVICILSVLNMIPVWLCALVVIASIGLTDRKALAYVDYGLLLTFIAFFIFVGNLSRWPAFSQFLQSALAGREMLISALTSQLISNVPAVMLLSPFTEDARHLLLGVNIGGMGTLVASLASLISYKLYSRRRQAKSGKYLLEFSAVNFSILVILLLFGYYLY
ncbi:MAG: citrate transporter [Firmicutes bacterium]|nr:citrate transporter [Bacillota bacterium]